MANKERFKSKAILITVGGLLLSSQAMSFEESMLLEEDLVNHVDNIEYIDDDAEFMESGVNPFMSISSNIEQMSLERRESESELSLIESQIELERRRFEKEMMPFQMEIERNRIQEELYAIQGRLSRPSEPPQVTISDIENRIDAVAGQMLRQQEEEIKQLKEERETQIRKENTFTLNLISESSNEKFAVIRNAHDEDFRVKEGEYANGWKVIGIDEANMRVVVKKGNKTEIISTSDSPLSIIASNSGRTNVSENNAGIDNIPPPNF